MLQMANSLNNKRKILSLEQCVNVLKRLDNGQSCRSVVLMCGCCKSHEFAKKESTSHKNGSQVVDGRVVISY